LEAEITALETAIEDYKKINGLPDETPKTNL
jgi:hypothetical protein